MLPKILECGWYCKELIRNEQTKAGQTVQICLIRIMMWLLSKNRVRKNILIWPMVNEELCDGLDSAYLTSAEQPSAHGSKIRSQKENGLGSNLSRCMQILEVPTCSAFARFAIWSSWHRIWQHHWGDSVGKRNTCENEEKRLDWSLPLP